MVQLVYFWVYTKKNGKQDLGYVYTVFIAMSTVSMIFLDRWMTRPSQILLRDCYLALKGKKFLTNFPAWMPLEDIALAK